MDTKLKVDVFDLNTTPIFRNVVGSMSKHENTTQNLLEAWNDIIFVWDNTTCSLLVANWNKISMKGGDKIGYQTLLPSSQLNFDVENLAICHNGSRIALFGSHGITILLLPQHYGIKDHFGNTKDKILCRSQNLDENFFIRNFSLELLQMRWHPAQLVGPMAVVLLSNNTMRVYNNDKLCYVWLADSNISKFVNDNIPNIRKFEQTAVDFDICDPKFELNKIVQLDENKDQLSDSAILLLEWPIVILKKNGEIFILMENNIMKTTYLHGPLTIYPSDIGNYDSDYCSLMLLHREIPTILIAETTGIVYHALLLKSQLSEEEIDLNKSKDSIEWTVNVVEKVELDLGIQKYSSSQFFTCPIRLKRDPFTSSRYYAYHNAGVHGIKINFLDSLKEFINSNDNIESPSLEISSRVEYIVCTQALRQSSINPVMGMSLFEMPPGLVIILGSGQVISLNIMIDSQFMPVSNLLTNTVKNDKNDTSIKPLALSSYEGSFVAHIQSIFEQGSNQPILSLHKSYNATASECLTLLNQAKCIFHETYMKNNNEVQKKIKKRVEILKNLTLYQNEAIKNLNNEKQQIQDTAEKLAEHCEELCDEQKNLLSWCYNLNHQINTSLPISTNTKLTARLNKIVNSLQNIAKSHKNIVKKMKAQQLHIKDVAAKVEDSPVIISKGYEDYIRNLLETESEKINDAMQNITKMKATLNMQT